MSLLAQLRVAGVAALNITGPNQLTVGSAAPLTDEARRLIKAHKPELIAALSKGPDLEGFQERAARLEHEEAMPQPAAEAAAARELGFASQDDLHQAVVLAWKVAIDSVHIIEPRAHAILNESRRFLASPLALQALRCGWTESELWSAALGAAPWRRQDHGLIVTQAWSSFEHPVVSIDGDRAKVGKFSFYRFRADGPAWWRHPALVRITEGERA